MERNLDKFLARVVFAILMLMSLAPSALSAVALCELVLEWRSGVVGVVGLLALGSVYAFFAFAGVWLFTVARYLWEWEIGGTRTE